MHPSEVDRRIRMMLATQRKPFRGRLQSIKRGRQVRVMQVLGLNGELLQEVELFQQFGHASCPPVGTMLMVLPLGGRTAHSVAVASELAGSQPDLQPGESVLYSALGDWVKVKAGRIVEVKAATQVVIDAPLATITHDLHVGGNVTMDGTLAVTGDISAAAALTATGNISSAADINAGGNIAAAGTVSDSVGNLGTIRTVHNIHNHNIPGGGTTLLPNQLD